jgi:hypothetical protein
MAASQNGELLQPIIHALSRKNPLKDQPMKQVVGPSFSQRAIGPGIPDITPRSTRVVSRPC